MKLITTKYIKLLFCDKTEKEFFFKLHSLLGFVPNKSYYFRKAFTHKSANCTEDNGKRFCNERLEFLGDTIIDSIIADYLFHLYPLETEGFLTKMKSRIVNRKSLNKIALDMHIENYLVCNIVDLTKNDALGNALEALIGAIYLDKGYSFTKKYMVKEILEKQLDFNFLETVDKNYKSQLLEITQKQKLSIEFDTNEANQSENTHSQSFVTTILIDQKPIATGNGKTKKEAEQEASRHTIIALR